MSLKVVYLRGLAAALRHISDPEEIKLRAAAQDAGHLKLATWGNKEQLQKFVETGVDPLRRAGWELTGTAQS